MAGHVCRLPTCRVCQKPILTFDCHATSGGTQRSTDPSWNSCTCIGVYLKDRFGRAMGLRRFMQSRRHTSLLVVGKCNAFVHFEENQSPDVVQQLQGRRWVKVHSRYRCQWTSDFADKKRGEEFLWCPVQTHTRQDNKHSHVANRPFICWNFCNKTHKKFSKICQNRFSEVKETINFKNLRGAAPNPAGGLTAPPPPPPDPQLDFC